MKTYFCKFLMMLIVNCNVITAMVFDPIVMQAFAQAAQQKRCEELSPIDNVFLNACRNDKSIDFSIEKGANIRAIDPVNGYNALHYACKNGNIDRIGYLRDKGLLLDYRAKDLLAVPLIELSKNDSLSSEFFCNEAKKLLDLGADVDSDEPKTALYYICTTCNEYSFDKAKFLLENGAGINHRVLRSAIISENTKCIWKFLEQPDINVKNVNMYGHNAIWELLTRYKKKDKLQLLQGLFDKGCGIAVDTIEEKSFMHVAALHGNVEIVDELYKRGIGVNGKDKYGKTCLHYAAECGDHLMVQKLLDLGALSMRDNNKKTPLQLARKDEKNKGDVIRVLKGESSKLIKKQKSQRPDKKTAREKTNNKKRQQTEEREAIATLSLHTKEEVKPGVSEIELVKEKNNSAIGKKDDEEAHISEVSIGIKNKKKKQGVIERAQAAVIKAITGSSTDQVAQKTYAVALGVNHTQSALSSSIEEKKSIALVDDRVKITAFAPMASECLILPLRDNPLALVAYYSDRVEEKRKNRRDLFHSFPSTVETLLGNFATQECIAPCTTKYIIEGTMETSSGMIYPGKFEYIVKENEDGKKEIVHRFFNPKKKHYYPSLPAPLERNGTELFQENIHEH